MTELHVTCKADVVIVKLGRRVKAVWKDLWQQLNRGMSILFTLYTTLGGYVRVFGFRHRTWAEEAMW